MVAEEAEEGVAAERGKRNDTSEVAVGIVRCYRPQIWSSVEATITLEQKRI